MTKCILTVYRHGIKESSSVDMQLMSQCGRKWEASSIYQHFGLNDVTTHLDLSLDIC